MDHSLNIVCLQWDIIWEDRQANYDQINQLLAKETITPGNVIVLPEMFDSGFSTNITITANNSDSIKFLSTLAKHKQCIIIAGITTIESTTGKGLNQCVTFNTEGKLISTYTKLHPFSLGQEDQYFSAGTCTETVHLNNFTFAPLICYDLRFPEAFRKTVLQGANVYTVIANWPTKRKDHFSSLLKARAIENQAYVIGVNRTGSDPNLDYGGQSQIISPTGEILDIGNDQPQAVKATLNLESLQAYRDGFPALKDINESLF